ncbi:hypothetical protein [Thermocrinis sp.]
MAGVWEEALVEEAIYLIAHLAQAEQHLMEIEGEAKVEELIPIIDELRNKRKTVGDILFSTLRIEEEKEKEEFRSKLESLWCSLKHLSMALVHCDETVEKLIRRLECHVQSGEDKKAQELSKRIKELYEVRQSIRNFIKMLLFDIPQRLTAMPQVRCREDLCIAE